MARHRYIAETIRDPQILGEVPLSSVSYGRALNGVGELSGTLAIPTNDTIASALIDATRRYRVIHVERDGTLVAPYVIWGRRYVRGARAVQIRAAELFSVIRRIAISSTLTYTQVDQATIVAGILNHVQGQTGADFGITFTPPATDRKRDRVYLASERKYAGEAFEQLSAVIDGFDWRIDSRWSGESIEREFILSHPRVGRRSAESQLTIDLDAPGVEMNEWSEDATGSSTRHTAIGAGDGDSQLMSTVVDMPAIAAGDPLLDSTEALKDVSDPGTLNGHAAQGLVDHRATEGVPSLRIRSDREPRFGSYIAGDDVRVRMSAGENPFFPDGIDRTQRITEWRLTVPDEGGPEMVDLTFGEVP